jgi:hypothetical protein
MKTLKITAALLTGFALASAPAFAEPQGTRGHQPQAHVQQSAPRAERAVPRAAARPEIARPVAPSVVRPSVGARPIAPNVVRPSVVAPRASVQPNVVVPGHAVPRAVPRSYAYPAHPYTAHPYVVHPYHPYVVAPYYRPYVFHPYFSVGFGFWAGYPVPYTYAYPYPVPVYGYGAPSTDVTVGPSSTQYGGVSLEVTPADASVSVDGGYAGVVRDFDGTEHTLTLASGRHHIEISAAGFQPMSFDVDTVPGQIVPYRGDLQPLH